MLPTVPLGQHRVSRLIIGGNPFSGGSHQSPERDREFMDYYTVAHIKAALFEAERQGINTLQVRADRHLRRMLREYRAEGGRLQWTAQTASELADQPAHLRQIAPEAIAIYQHGSRVDALWREGRIDEIRDLLSLTRDLGVAVGLGTHLPEVIEYVEERGWDVDFYMACFYALTRERHESPVVAGSSAAARGEVYDDADRERMCATIRATPRTCLAFKILAAGRHCATADATRAAFEYAFANIKPRDAVVVGVYQGRANQVAADAAIVADLCDRQADG